MEEINTKQSMKKLCAFCGFKKKNKIKYGPMYTLGNITAHYYCVLLSNNLQQNGEDDEGIFGFLLPDIKMILNASTNDFCIYCNKGHATLKCAFSKCRRIYHFLCGVNNKCLSQFFGQFKNFCHIHKPKQNIPKEYLLSCTKNSTICSICYEIISFKDWNKILWAPCCKKNWYHRKCIQQLAHSMGYLFKCAICNDVHTFKNWMLRFGIFIPKKDASWELVPNAFEELLFRHNTCDAEKCNCPEGRQKNIENTRWEIILCHSCGSQGIHISCGKLKFIDPKWQCNSCSAILNNIKLSDVDISEHSNWNNFNQNSDQDSVNVIPGSSIAASRSTLESKETRKRKFSDDSENFAFEKRKKIDMPVISDDIIDVETVEATKVCGALQFSQVSSSTSSSLDKSNSSSQNYLINESKEPTNVNGEANAHNGQAVVEILIDSSDSEDDVVVISDGEEIQVIDVIKRQKKFAISSRTCHLSQSSINVINISPNEDTRETSSKTRSRIREHQKKIHKHRNYHGMVS